MAYTTIDDPSAHFQTALWSGDDATTQDITNDGNSDLQPDWVWVKCRNTNGNGFDHTVWDTSRGVSDSVNTSLSPSQNDVEGLGDNVTTTAQLGGVSAMLSDGFTVREGSIDDDSRYVNENTRTYVGWQWKANGGSRTTFAEDGNNPAGGYQANTTAGFSIVDYVGTGAAGTMAHGLGAVPSLIIIKNRDEADSGMVYHKHMTAAPETDYMVLDTTANPTDNADRWNDTAPTSSVFTIATDHSVNADGENYIAYLWTPIQGYSAFGGPYTGNGNEDGPFQYTGFKPAYVVTKLLDTDSHHWTVYQTDGVGYNKDATKSLYWNTDYAEVDGTSGSGRMDFLSNGFKLRHTSFDGNWDGATYIWMAFAHQPFVTSGGVPCTAR